MHATDDDAGFDAGNFLQPAELNVLPKSEVSRSDMIPRLLGEVAIFPPPHPPAPPSRLDDGEGAAAVPEGGMRMVSPPPRIVLVVIVTTESVPSRRRAAVLFFLWATGRGRAGGGTNSCPLTILAKELYRVRY